ncbi:ABC transporter ATP-binding protein [Aerosakkonemataceae cyanobacterium BLCC-F154]|uniref:ABC transporter ATP-binding protein n=1 Tax=Floridaenema fluviatile BLCC-F154 TaxID=3153640 RepID=A0ABV4YEZ2_9CYAN
MLKLHKIYQQFGGNCIIKDISFNLSEGEILCLLGPSGCGKTTLLQIAAGLIIPTSGKVENSSRQTAYVFQEHRLLPWRTTLENLTIGLTAKGISPKQKLRVAQKLAAQLGLENALHLYPDRLSGGMQQRVALGRALAIDPNLLLLDEPFSALDVGLRRQLQRLVLDLITTRNLAAILVSHDLGEAVLMSDRLLVLSPSPSRIVYDWQIERSKSQRDEAYIYKSVCQLQQIPEVALSFNLPSLSLEFESF